MKKIICTAILAVLFISFAFAGDIPESFLGEDGQIFFGEIVFSHFDSVSPSIQVSPVKVIKGDVKEGTLQTYLNPTAYGNITPKQDEIYLFAYLDEANGIDIFEVTTLDTQTLKLKNVEGDMWRRFEKYINEGRYGVAKVDGRLSPESKRKTSTAIAVCAALLAAIGGAVIPKRKKGE